MVIRFKDLEVESFGIIKISIRFIKYDVKNLNWYELASWYETGIQKLVVWMKKISEREGDMLKNRRSFKFSNLCILF